MEVLKDDKVLRCSNNEILLFTELSPESSLIHFNKDKCKLKMKVMQHCVALTYSYIQLTKSSRAIQWGAIFLAVFGWKLILISSPEAYEHRECCGLLVFLSCSLLFTTSTILTGSHGVGCRIFKWISHVEDHKYLSGNKSLWTKVTNLTIHINGNHGVLLKL